MGSAANGKRSAGIGRHAAVLAGHLNANEGALQSHADAVPVDIGVSRREAFFCAGLRSFSAFEIDFGGQLGGFRQQDRKSTRLNSSHTVISYAVFCLKKKKKKETK